MEQRDETPSMISIMIVLAHELGCALEIGYDPIEMREIWADAIDALRDFDQVMKEKGMPTLVVVTNVLRLSQSGA